MDRGELLSTLDAVDLWDFLVIGGGASGLGVALEAATRGYRTLLVEQSDFCKGTSSRSTKLIHGGVRYLKQGNLILVMDALRERGRLLKNAPHIVKPLSLVIPTYSLWQTGYYAAGLVVYDLLAGMHRIGRSRPLSAEQVQERVPGLKNRNLRGGVLFHDAQFDDTRLSIALARTCRDSGGTLINYTRVISILKSGDRITGAVTEDAFTGVQREINARVVVNCTGVFSDQVRHLDAPSKAMITPSQGTHLVLDRSFLDASDCGVLIPRTEDGRVLFAIPWRDRVLAGTTDIPVDQIELEPKATPEEIEYILSHLGLYFAKKPQSSDILSVFAGIRPLVRSTGTASTASISRDHRVIVSPAGMVSVIGGKWTTYRQMAENAVEQAVLVAGLPSARGSVTKTLRLQEAEDPGGNSNCLSRLISERPALAETLHPSAPYCLAEVVRAVRQEWACTLEDVLARRTRLLFLDARASMEAATTVTALMAAELGRNEKWQNEQISDFRKLAARYLPRGE